MRSTIERRLAVLEQRRGRAPYVVRVRLGETAESARARHERDYPHAAGRPVIVTPMPCATTEEWIATFAPRTTA